MGQKRVPVFLLYLITLLLVGAIVKGVHRYEDLCSSTAHRRIYMEFGDEGLLRAGKLNGTNPVECHLEVVTCPSCVVALNFSDLNNTICHEEKDRGDCPCDLLEVSEPPYKRASTKRYCGGPTSYITLTRSAAITIIARGQIVLHYRAHRNRVYLRGEEGDSGYLSSPFFPSLYPHDLNVEYFITCATNGCLIKLLFSDFQLAMKSIMEFFDWNGVRLDVVTGAQFRPAAVVSSGPSLVVRFYANGGTSLGYNANYKFLENLTESQPLTDCGGHVDDLGGAITMMDMVTTGMLRAAYDCFWIVRPSRSSALHFNSHIYLKIADFTKMDVNTKLTVHLGTTSNGRLLEVLRGQTNDTDEVNPRNPREHVTSIDVGFYVRLKAIFVPDSRLAIVYAGFSYARGDTDCFTSADYLCDNRRCVARRLSCDGFDQCGDSSDEPAICYDQEVPVVAADRRPRWYSHTPNYLFPKIDQYTDLHTATLIFVISSLGLVALVSALFVLLYRINARSRHGSRPNPSTTVTHNQHLQIVADSLLEEDIIDVESVTDEPPIYEAPPRYEECVTKTHAICSEEMMKPRRHTRKNRRKTRRLIQKGSHCAETPSTPPPRYEDASVSRSSSCSHLPDGSSRRRWRSHSELLNTGTVATMRTLLMPHEATASDSELLNMRDPCSPFCDCESDTDKNPNKFYTR